MMTAPLFWWRQRPSLGAILLWPGSLVWGRVAAGRISEAPKTEAAVPVVCVGNFVVGGAGKTPAALELARIARSLGFRPGFLTRGYGGKTRDPLLVDLDRHDAAEVGDEALLLADSAPTVVSPDRPAALPLLAFAGVDLIIMDDGFQNPSLAKDLCVVLVDGGVGLGNGFVMPAGPLRAPLRPQLVRADLIVVVGDGRPGDQVLRLAAKAGKPVMRARLEPLAIGLWGARRFLAFAGIGRPEKFFNTLDKAGVPLKDVKAFPDHHPYTADDARKLLNRAESEKLGLITTTKDYARLANRPDELAELRQKTDVFAIRLAFDQEDRIAALLRATAARVAAARVAAARVAAR